MSWYSIVRRGGTTSTLWDPSQLSGLDAWYDADDASTLTLSGSAVSSWSDKSGNGYDASQATQSLQPTLISGGLNGRDVVNMTQDVLSASSLQLAGVDRQVFVVATIESSAGAWARVWQFLETGGTTTMWALARYKSSSEIYGLTNDAGSPRHNPGYGSAFIASLSIGFYGGSLYADGQLVGSASKYNATLDATGGMRIGSAGNVAEVIVCDGLIESKRQQVEGYLAHKWGLTANLPVAHPYKTTAPTA